MEPFNPLDVDLAVDPYPAYAALRSQEPVHLSALGAYVLTRHDDVSRLLSDTGTFQHQYVVQQKTRLGPEVGDEPYFDFFRQMIFVSDDPTHRRLRKLMHKAFTLRGARDMRSRAEAIAAQLVEAESANRSMDVIRSFAYPFPLRVIGSILGIPDTDHETIGTHATALNPVLEFLPMQPDVLNKANESIGVLAEYFGALAAKRRSDPTDDLFSAMVHASEDGEVLSKAELIANAILLYVAGHETTAGGTGLALLALHRNPEQWAKLRADPTLIPAAVEELLRYDTPGQGTARVTTEDVEFGGQIIPAGNVLLGYIGAANRDPEAYDEPDRLNIERDFSQAPRPMTWGGGAHLCLGRMLALQEFEVALTLFVTQFPKLKIDESSLSFRPTPLMRGLESLTLEW